MRDGAGRRKERAPPFLVCRHARGDLVQLVEALHPERLVNVDVSMIALGAPAVVAEEVEGSCSVRRVQHQRVPFQLNAESLFRKVDDVRPENLGLGAGCRQENLIVTREAGVFKGFLCEIPCKAELSGLEEKAVPVLAGFQQLALVWKEPLMERLGEVILGQMRHIVFELLFPLPARLFLALFPFRHAFQSPFPQPETLEPFEGRHQRVDLSEVVRLFRLPLNQYRQPPGRGLLRALMGKEVIPAPGLDPVVERPDRDAERGGHFPHGIAAQVEGTGRLPDFFGP